ncbi:MAG: Uma2 family endonuclease [Gemmataceae bacterium]|nr:Uma2 family endonuclease [Gemmataceae bacterium]MCI0739285.1 Uma2 family endonuclease [Gemmataceae bacterium]
MIVPTLTRKGSFTFDDFLVLVPDGQRADLIDGVIYMASPDNIKANDLNAWLAAVVRGFVDEYDLGDVYISRVAYRLSRKHSPEPDLSFLPKARAKKKRRGYILGPPALAVEIVSPDSVYRDYVQKFALYQKAGVDEYWIIDPDERKATFFTLRKGKFEEMPVKDGVFTSKVLPGFHFEVRWLWDENRPSAYAVVKQLLGD